MTKSTLLHLRIPFSFLLLPVFLLAACLAQRIDWLNFALAFAIIHLLLYPAANSFNSYYDKDASSIGGLENPPPVDRSLLAASLLLDAMAVLLGLLISWEFSAALLVYGLCSKLYSHSATRLKKRPVASAIGIALGQGALCFMMSYYGVQEGGEAFAPPLEPLLLAAISSLALLGVYPISQVYQHEEDARRGDLTLSMLLGVKGTFVFSGAVLLVSGLMLFLCLLAYQGTFSAILLLALAAPAAASFLKWGRECLADPAKALYRPAMRTLLLGATGMNILCAALFAMARL